MKEYIEILKKLHTKIKQHPAPDDLDVPALLRDTGFIDPAYYKKRYQDIARCGADPAYHYLR